MHNIEAVEPMRLHFAMIIFLDSEGGQETSMNSGEGQG